MHAHHIPAPLHGKQSLITGTCLGAAPAEQLASGGAHNTAAAPDPATLRDLRGVARANAVLLPPAERAVANQTVPHVRETSWP